jgi:hypothetical protein
MTTDVPTAPTATATAEPAQPVLPRGFRATDVISSLATRLSFIVVAWVLLANGAGWAVVGTVLTAQTVGYLGALPFVLRVLDRVDAGRVSLVADLASALVIATLAFVTDVTSFTADAVGLMALVAACGALRAASDVAKNMLSDAAMAKAAPTEAQPVESDGSPAPPREGLVGLAAVAIGAAGGAAVAWLGPAGALWLLALVCAVTAARVVLADTSQVSGHASPAQHDGEADALSAWREQPHDRRVATVLFLTGLLTFTGAATLISVWARDVFAAAGEGAGSGALGIVGGAFMLGAIGGGVVFTASAGEPLRYLLLAIAFVAGAGAVGVFMGMLPALLLVVAVAVLAGLAMASVNPTAGLKLCLRAPAALRGRVGALAAAATYLGIPVGAFAAGWLVPRASLIVGVAVAAGCYLAAMLVPVLAHRTWQEVTPRFERPVTVLRRNPKLSARLSVTLAYADGQWVAELRKGRALLGRRYMVNSTEALTMLSVLDVSALTSRVEDALTTDKTEAGRQVERLRTELAELEAKLNGLTEMVDHSERGKTP